LHRIGIDNGTITLLGYGHRQTGFTTCRGAGKTYHIIMGHIVMGLHMISDTLSIPACLSFAVFCPNENTALMSSYQGGALCF
jgi:hypothetical protein